MGQTLSVTEGRHTRPRISPSGDLTLVKAMAALLILTRSILVGSPSTMDAFLPSMKGLPGGARHGL